MNKKFAVFLSALFCCFIGGMALVSLLLPKKAFSPMENRYLQKTPLFSLERVTSGAFMSDAESYVSDHIAGRDLWVAMKAWSERLSGKQENNGVYFGKNDTLINRVDQPDMDQLEQNLSYVDALTADLSVPVYFGLIPSSAAIWAERLPLGAPTADEKGIIHQLSYETGAQSIDLYAALDAHKSEDIYYRTDHHWTSLGAYYGANALLEEMGLPALKLEDYARTTVSDSFYGTTFSTSGVRWVRPDRIDTYVPEDGLTVTGYPNGTAQPGSLYVPEKLEEKDKYSFFLGGNQPLCVIENPDIQDGSKILLIRDSYSDSLAPFLAQAFSQVHLIDLRYYHASVAEYMAEHSIKTAVVLYSAANFISDRNLIYLGQAGTAVPEMSAQEAFGAFLAGDYEKLNFRSYDFFSTWQYCNDGHLDSTLLDVDGDGTEELLVQYENSPGDLHAVFDYDSGWINC